jgi:hypothetical protein
LISIVALLAFSASADDYAGGETYVSWGLFEPDKCATVWLIKRHIDPKARFAFVERDAELPEGIAFDTPGAKFRRYHNRCTYETFLEHHQLSDERLVYIGRLMHDIEVNVWERKALADTARVEAEILEILSDDDPEGNVEACLAYFDALYSSL